MVSQLVKVPVLLKKTCSDRQTLQSLGPVTETEAGWVIYYTARVGYFLDDETFIHEFCHVVARFGVTVDDVIRFAWENAEKVKQVLP